MRRTTRMLTGGLLAAGLGLTGCSFGGDEADLDGTGVPAVFQEEEVGGPDPVDGGDEDADGVDPGTGGIDDDDNVRGGSDADDIDQDGPSTDVEDTEEGSLLDDGGETGADTGPDTGPDTVENSVVD